MSCRRLTRDRIDIFRALDSFRRELERPGDHESDRKSNRDQHDERLHHPFRRLKRGNTVELTWMTSQPTTA